VDNGECRHWDAPEIIVYPVFFADACLHGRPLSLRTCAKHKKRLMDTGLKLCSSADMRTE
jgi:hypothetical protein